MVWPYYFLLLFLGLNDWTGRRNEHWDGAPVESSEIALPRNHEAMATSRYHSIGSLLSNG